MKQRKGVSAAERELFSAALKDVRPIKVRVRSAPAPLKPVRIPAPSPHFPPEPTYNEKAAPPIGGHADAHLRRGRLEPERRLDLHGLTQTAAYRALLGFLFAAQTDGQKLVLVITGKGGVLRGQLPLWLGQPDMRALVGGISQAHIKHGGAGAFYVRVKKQGRTR
jgi:DNA-nicking Smr family endonuclease